MTKILKHLTICNLIYLTILCTIFIYLPKITDKIEDQNKNVIVNNSLGKNDIKLAGLYDPAENGLSIDMWSNSNGKEIKTILGKLNSKKLSKFSEKILDVALLTNSYLPSNNITNE